jgi:hypothetical protein
MRDYSTKGVENAIHLNPNRHYHNEIKKGEISILEKLLHGCRFLFCRFLFYQFNLLKTGLVSIQS